MPIVLGCDIGTTSVKVVAVNQEGVLLYQAQRAYEMYHPQPDWHEQDANEIATATLACIQEVVHFLAPIVPEALIFSAAMHSLMVIDDNNRPLTPLIIWADNRSVVQAQNLKETHLGEDIYHQTGTPIHPMSPLCKLLWLKEHQSQYLQASYKYVGIKEYVLYQLTKLWIIDYSIASATGMFNIHTKQWHQSCLSLLGISEEQLPIPVSPLTQIALSPDITFLPSSIKIIPGASDGCLSNLGAGALSEGKLALTIGTSAAVRVAIKSPYTTPSKSTFCYLLDDETYISGGGSNSGGKVFDWAASNFFPNDLVEKLTDLVQQTPSTSLLFFPYLFGERAPLWNAHVKGGFYGLDITHTTSHMLRAVQEGILFNLLLISEDIEQHQSIDTIYANGGFVSNTYWVQMLADIFNKTIILNESKEAAAIGAAILGFKSLGIIKHYEEATHFQTELARYQPNSTVHEHYKQLFLQFKKHIAYLQ